MFQQIDATNLKDLLVTLGWSHWAGNLWSKDSMILTLEDAIAFELRKALQSK
jgi:hypothetical protein